LEHSHRYGRK
jgi:hypothetical protein